MAPAPMYDSFAAVTLLVLGLLVLLARASQSMFDDSEGAEASDDAVPATGAARIERHAETGQSRAERRALEIVDEETDGGPWENADETPNPWRDAGPVDATLDREVATDAGGAGERAVGDATDERAGAPDELEFTTWTLLANVAVSQGVFGAALLGAAWAAEIPPAALGVVPADPWNAGLPAVGLGVAVGVVLYAANELSAKVVDAAGVEYSEGLREALAPDSRGGWAVLLGVVLPVIAGFEELLFRAALVGAFSAGFGVSPWILAVLSTVAFAVGHGAQGPGGVAVTGLLGLALAVAFVLTGSLLVVVVAHYVVNALEFGVHEGLGIE